VETLVEAPDSLPGRRRYTGCYIKWRQADDGKGGSSPDDRIFNLFVSDVEARYVLPGMRARVVPMLVTKKSTKRLNLTSKFGSFMCMSDGIVSELPDGAAPRLGPNLVGSREGSSSSIGSASSVDLVSVGKIKLAKQSPAASMNFTYADVVTPLVKRALRSGDRVELKFAPDPAVQSITVSVTLTLEGFIRKRGSTDPSCTPVDGDDFYCNSELEVFCKAEDAVPVVGIPPEGDLSYPIDPDNDEAVLGFLPLRVGDRVRFHVNASGRAESISVISEVPGRIRAIGTVVLRGDNSVIAVYPPKTFTKLLSGTYVLTRIDWQDTHFRILQMRIDPDASSSKAAPVEAPKQQRQAARSTTKVKKGKKAQQQQQAPLLAVPRPTTAYVDKSPQQPNVKFHGTNPLRAFSSAQEEPEVSRGSAWASFVD
jgi:hypothetical protein